MTNVSLQSLLKKAEAALKSGDARTATMHYQEILRQYPSNQRAQTALLKLSKQPQTKAQGSLPDPIAKRIMQALSSGLIAEAADLATKATFAHPQAFQGWLLRGVTLQVAGDFARAERAFDKAARLNPRSAISYYNRGLMQQHLRKLGEAQTSYELCLRLDPKMLDALNNLGVILRDRGQPMQARVRWQQVLDIDPDHADALINWGNTCVDERDMETGIDYYRRAVAAQPAHKLALANLCEAYEKSNLLEELDTLLLSLDAELVAQTPALGLQLASLYFRQKDYAACCKQLEGIDAERESLEFGSKYYELMGKAREKLNDFGSAFEAYRKLNLVVASNHKSYLEGDSSYLRRTQQRANEDWTEFGDWVKAEVENCEEAPVFLVGFPRSGTTLLDTFLRGHPEVQVFEEVDAVAQMMGVLPDHRTLGELLSTEESTKQAMRSAYQRALAQHSTVEGRRVWIDKLPLNMVNVAEIQTAFPRAKYILALRHPLDCILSCYKQNFVINTAMYIMTDLVMAAELYSNSFDVFTKAIEASGASCLNIRYEDLLVNPQSSLQDALTFLDLPWDERVLEHEKTAKGRGKINTPSYSQVTQPLYTESVYLWRNYETELADVKSLIEPWVKRFGYTL